MPRMSRQPWQEGVLSGNRRLYTGTSTLGATGQTWAAYDIVVSADAPPRIVETNRVESAPDRLRATPKK